MTTTATCQRHHIKLLVLNSSAFHQVDIKLLTGFWLLGRLFRQPLVPLVSAADGKWLVPEGLAPILKPGGHGAIWKLMLDEGVFSWMYQHDREAAIVRQIRHAHFTQQCSTAGLSAYHICTVDGHASAMTVH